MDSGRGHFEEAENEEGLARLKEEYPLHGGVFRKGEIVELKGSRFKIKTISPKELRLKLLPRAATNKSAPPDRRAERE